MATTPTRATTRTAWTWEGTVKKILTTEYVQNALKEMEAEKKA